MICRSAERLLDGIGNPGDDAVVGQAKHDIAHVLPGLVDVPVDQIDDAAVAPHGLENDLRIEHRVGARADEPRRLKLGLHPIGVPVGVLASGAG
jgi:hypothetical protein